MRSPGHDAGAANPDVSPRPGGAKATRAIRKGLALGAIGLVASGATILGSQGYVRVKGALAERLIDRAWEQEKRDGAPHRPWSWADLHPIASLDAPRLGIHRIVLSGASGNALAFGLGHMSGTAPPGGAGVCGIAGHRDTWASFLRDLTIGDEIRIETRDGIRRYKVEGTRVALEDRVDLLDAEGASPRLLLITCWPFSGIRRSPWRYLVTCVPQAPADASGMRR